MPHLTYLRNFKKTSQTPRRPFERERIDAEMHLIATYGLKNKREVWRVHFMLSKIRKAARMLLTLEEADPRRQLEGRALLRRLVNLGLLSPDRMKLDFVLGLTERNFLERRLQTMVFKRGLARSIHHARVLIQQRHICVGRQLVDIPSYLVRLKNENYIDLSMKSPLCSGHKGRSARKTQKRKQKQGADAGFADDED